LVYTIDSIHSSLLAIAESKNVNLSCYRDPALTPVISADALRIRQIVTNLVGNSIKFSSGQDRKGDVKLRFDSNRGNELRIVVEDNGIGIAKESLKSIFDPFKQEDASTAQHFGGTGLGLPITKLLVEKMDGHLKIESEPGVFTRVTVILPLIVVAGLSTPEFMQTLLGVHCNLYSDDEDQARDWSSLLTYEGAKVHRVDNAEDLINSVDVDSISVKNVIGISIDSKLDVDYYESLITNAEGKKLSKLIAVMPVVKSVVDSVSETLTLVENNPNRNVAFYRVLAAIDGEVVEMQNVTHDVELKHFETKSADCASTQETQVALSEDSADNNEIQVLVAEDNAINQNVISNQLEALGYSYELANDGKEAFELWQHNDYTMLLTDLHMPEMDGYTLATEIRRQENNGKRLPIVAYTANALKGEKDRCLDCGMDDYLTKPIAIKDLKSILASYVNGTSINTSTKEVSDASISVRTSSSTATLDISILKHLVGDDSKVIEGFLIDYRKAAQKASFDLDEALRNKDWAVIRGIAHTLKSTSRAVGAITLGEVCDALEQAGIEQHEVAIHQAMSDFEVAIVDFYQALPGNIAQTEANGPADHSDAVDVLNGL